MRPVRSISCPSLRFRPVTPSSEGRVGVYVRSLAATTATGDPVRTRRARSPPRAPRGPSVWPWVSNHAHAPRGSARPRAPGGRPMRPQKLHRIRLGRSGFGPGCLGPGHCHLRGAPTPCLRRPTRTIAMQSLTQRARRANRYSLPPLSIFPNEGARLTRLARPAQIRAWGMAVCTTRVPKSCAREWPKSINGRTRTPAKASASRLRDFSRSWVESSLD